MLIARVLPVAQLGLGQQGGLLRSFAGKRSVHPLQRHEALQLCHLDGQHTFLALAMLECDSPSEMRALVHDLVKRQVQAETYKQTPET